MTMRCLTLLLLSLTLPACGSDEGPAPPVAPKVEPPAPPPSTGDPNDLATLLPQEPAPLGDEPTAPAASALARAAPSAARKPNEPAEQAVEVARDLPAMTVLRAALAPRLEDREPVDVTDRFADGAAVYCFTQIANPSGRTRTLHHRWIHEGKVKSDIKLRIKGQKWRTNSSRPVYGKGAWRVDIVDEGGAVLRSLPFTVH